MIIKNNIVIAGYPKSGNTWLTRLVAEVLKCPVVGFLEQPQNNEIAIEGSAGIRNTLSLNLITH